MRVIKRLPLVEFARRHPEAAAPLGAWYRVAIKARWASFAAVRQTFRHADLVRAASGSTVVVFDVGGNKFRLVARISYNKQKLYVLRIMTHQEYGRKHWLEQL